MRSITSAVLLALVMHPTLALAGKYNETLSIGAKPPAWKDLTDVVSGNEHSLSDLNEAEVVVVVFTCNSCPIATEYEDRIIKLAEQHGVGAKDRPGKVALVAINVNKVPADLPPAMKARAEKKKYPFPYLFDETQQIARDYGALFTPEYFVLDRERRIVYMGGMDDKSDSANVKKDCLQSAVEAVLAGKKPAIAETPPVGCRIRFARSRQ